MQKNEPIKAK